MPKGHGLSEATKDAIWELRALGLSEAEVGRRLGFAPVTVSRYVARAGGIRPRPRRRPARCLHLSEREEISRAIARGDSARQIARALGRSHTTITRELNRCGGRQAYRALYVQTRGSLKRELTAHLRRRRQRRFARSQSSKGQGQGKIAEMVMISERPPEVEDRAPRRLQTR